MRRFELKDAKSDKFWCIVQTGSDVQTTWGRVGTNGQSKVKTLASDAAAQKEAEKLIRAKTKKGYAEVTDPEALAATPTPTPKLAEKPTQAKSGPAASTANAPAAKTRGARAGAGAAPQALPDESKDIWAPAWRALVRPTADALGAGKPSTLEEARAALDQILAKHGKELRYDLRDLKSPVLAGMWRRGASSTTVGYPLSELVMFVHSVTLRLQRGAAWTLVDLIVHEQGLEVAMVCALLARLHANWSPDPVHALNRVAWHIARADADTRDALYSATEAIYKHQFSPEDVAPTFAPIGGYNPPMTTDGALGQLGVGCAYLFADSPLYDAALASCATGPDGNRAGQLSLLLNAARSTDEVALLMDSVLAHGWYVTIARREESLKTLAQTLGPAMLPRLSDEFQQGNLSADEEKLILGCVAGMAADEAAAFLAAHAKGRYAREALRKYAAQFPVRATRAMAERALAGHIDMRPFLREQRRLWPAAWALVAAELVPDALDELERLLQDPNAGKPVAALTALPDVLAAPPWRAKKTRAKKRKTTVTLTPVQIEAVVTPPAEVLEKWRRDIPGKGLSDERKATFVAQLKSDPDRYAARHIVYFTPEDAAAIMPRLIGGDHTFWPEAAAGMLAVHGALVLPLLAREFTSSPDMYGPMFMHACSRELADVMVGAFGRTKKARTSARAWMLAHPRASSVVALETALLGKGAAQKHAAMALRLLVSEGHVDVVRAAAAELGCTEEAAPLLTYDPLRTYPTTPKDQRGKWPLDDLVRPVLKETGEIFPIEALEVVLDMLAMSPLEDAYAGLEVLREVCTPASLAACVWSVFDVYRREGYPTSGAWALSALGHFGDDAAALNLAALVRKWPGESQHQRAVKGLDVLLAIGTDAALTELNGIAQKVKFKGIKQNAQERIQALADARGMSADELADRLVPTLGLDTDGSKVLNFGPRTFTVGFDEELKPFVKDEAGKRRKSLPKPGKKDDEALATAANDTWKLLKKQARTLSKLQIARLEQAMCTERTWLPADFAQFLVDHPLMVHLTQRLVWGTYDEAGALTATFRVSEDRTYADAEDEPFEVQDAARVGIVHPAQTTTDVLEGWGEVFADYELLQPFTQLSRVVHAIPEERAKAVAWVPEAERVEATRVLSMLARGWQGITPQDAGCIPTYFKPLGDGRYVCFDMDMGIIAGMALESESQKIERIYICENPEAWRRENDPPLGSMSGVQYSELHRDIMHLLGET